MEKNIAIGIICNTVSATKLEILQTVTIYSKFFFFFLCSKIFVTYKNSNKPLLGIAKQTHPPCSQ